jgi:short-subunit dehydrogenase
MKTVLITGASSGLGKEVALEFSREGYNLILVSRNLENLKRVVDQIKRNGGSAMCFVVDVSKQAKVRRLKKELDKRNIKVDILINDAGIGVYGNVNETATNDILKMVEVNYFGGVYFTKIFLDDIVSKKGCLVFINSIAGKILVPSFGSYCASKAALDFFADSLAKEMKDQITIINVYPGPMNTPFWDQESLKRLKRRYFFSEPSWVARKIFKAVHKRKRKVVIPSWLNLLLILDKFSPNSVYWLFRKIYKI